VQNHEYSIKPHIAKINSNRAYIPYFSFGDHFQQAANPVQSYTVEMTVNVENDLVPPENLFQTFQSCRGCDGIDAIYYERRLGMGITAKMHVENLFTGAKLTVNNSYYKYVRAKIDNAYPVGVHLADFLILNLLEKGYTPLHCAAIASQDTGTLIIGPPDSGKSLTTILALKQGFRYLSEDVTFVDGKNVYANPYTSTFVHNNKSRNLRDILREVLPITSYFFEGPRRTIRDLVKDLEIDEKAEVKNIFILDQAKEESAQRLSASEALRRILIINRNEFSYYKNPIILAYSYFNSTLDVSKLMQIEEQIISSLLEKTDCFLIKSSNPKNYIKMIQDILRK
jgi:hypothetical protein